MISVRARSVVPAPVERVFAFMDDPANQAAITPALRDVAVLADRGDGGKRVRHRYALAGLTYEGVVDATTYDPPERIEWRLTGEVEGTITQTFEPHAEGTLVTYAARYEMPLPGPFGALDRAFAPLVNRANGWVLRRTLSNLRTALANGRGAADPARRPGDER